MKAKYIYIYIYTHTHTQTPINLWYLYESVHVCHLEMVISTMNLSHRVFAVHI
jgi:hypothetical protein